MWLQAALILLFMLISATVGFLVAWFWWGDNFRQKLGAEKQAYKQKLQVAHRTLKTLRTHVEKKNQTIDSLAKELKDERESSSDLKGENDQLRGRNWEQFEQTIVDHETERAELNRKYSQIHHQKKQLEEENQILKEKLLHKERQLQELRQQANRAQKEAEPPASEVVPEFDINPNFDFSDEDDWDDWGDNKQNSGPQDNHDEPIYNDSTMVFEPKAILEQLQEDDLERPLSERDDLKKIKGIGPVIERMLNEHGITRYRQIAMLSEEDIEFLASRMKGFPDRIQRDGWISHALEQHELKYGEILHSSGVLS